MVNKSSLSKHNKGNLVVRQRLIENSKKIKIKNKYRQITLNKYIINNNNNDNKGIIFLRKS